MKARIGPSGKTSLCLKRTTKISQTMNGIILCIELLGRSGCSSPYTKELHASSVSRCDVPIEIFAFSFGTPVSMKPARAR